MSRFSSKSEAQLASCDPRLRDLFRKVIQVMDCTIIEGYRGEMRQNELFRTGRSKVEFPSSKHNAQKRQSCENPLGDHPEMPWYAPSSRAVDVAPYPIDWNDTKRFYYFAGHVMGIAHRSGVKLRYGGDWDRDNDLNDQNFNDLVHFELID